VTLTDAGPLVAILDRGQGQIHQACVAALPNLALPLVTTWPCFTEAMHFLGRARDAGGPRSLWRLVEQGVLRFHETAPLEIQRMMNLMEKYADVPMDLADSSIVAAAESLGVHRVFTLDSDFRIYRFDGTQTFEIVA
jgi:predicted nucleic acid-binding protein